AVLAARGTGAQGEQYDFVLMGGRVLDPETGLDAKRNVGIRDGRIAAVTVEPLAARETLVVAGLVVAPGFIDLHAHGQDSESYRYYAPDRVTTALELEIGTYPESTLWWSADWPRGHWASGSVSRIRPARAARRSSACSGSRRVTACPASYTYARAGGTWLPGAAWRGCKR